MERLKGNITKELIAKCYICLKRKKNKIIRFDDTLYSMFICKGCLQKALKLLED